MPDILLITVETLFNRSVLGVVGRTISGNTVHTDMMYLFTTVPHPHGHWQLQELLGNQIYTI